ncbi:hypothetical protein EI555_016466, partial [Monodon monoceros]
TGCTSHEKLRPQQLLELRRRQLKDQELSRRELCNPMQEGNKDDSSVIATDGVISAAEGSSNNQEPRLWGIHKLSLFQRLERLGYFRTNALEKKWKGSKVKQKKEIPQVVESVRRMKNRSLCPFPSKNKAILEISVLAMVSSQVAKISCGVLMRIEARLWCINRIDEAKAYV